MVDRGEVTAAVGPLAQGVRMPYAALPEPVREWVDSVLGAPIVAAETRTGGFSPGAAAVVTGADGRRAFVKAVSAETNPVSPDMHRREARAAAALPVEVPAPRLLAAYDDGTWVALVFEAVDGRQPHLPWRTDELDRVLAMLGALAESLTPSPWAEAPPLSERMRRPFSGWRRIAASDAPPGLDDWSRRHLDALAALEARWEEAAAGDTLLHHDVRADNLLLDADRVWLVDWPAASRGAAWVDVVMFAVSVSLQGGPPPAGLLRRHPPAQAAEPAAVDAYLAAAAGYLTRQSLLPPPPGLPTIREFQAAYAAAARSWLAERTGWS